MEMASLARINPRHGRFHPLGEHTGAMVHPRRWARNNQLLITSALPRNSPLNQRLRRRNRSHFFQRTVAEEEMHVHNAMRRSDANYLNQAALPDNGMTRLGNELAEPSKVTLIGASSRHFHSPLGSVTSPT